METLSTLAERARLAQALPKGVPSPCISVCTMNAASGLCDGCLRTLEEISAWSVLADQEKRGIWALIAQRVNAEPS